MKGNLRTFSLVQLFNLIHLARKTGALNLRQNQQGGTTAHLYFLQGKLGYASLNHERSDLLEHLLQLKRITPQQYQALLQRTQGMTDKEIGLMLVNAGQFTPEEILQVLMQGYRNVVRTLFSWPEGEFAFDPKAPPPKGKILVRMGLENLIIEGARQLREWERLQREIPTLDVALKFVDRPRTDIKQLNLSAEEWKVLKYVSPRNTLRKIAQALGLSDMEMRRIVYGLIEAGLVELVRPEAEPLPQIPLAFADKPKEERISLINRIIERIRSL